MEDGWFNVCVVLTASARVCAHMWTPAGRDMDDGVVRLCCAVLQPEAASFQHLRPRGPISPVTVLLGRQLPRRASTIATPKSPMPLLHHRNYLFTRSLGT